MIPDRIRQSIPPRPGMEATFQETTGMPTGFVVGVDLGQAKDYTAVVVNERTEAEQIKLQRASPFEIVPGEVSRKRLIRHGFTFLHRFPLGTPYPEVVERVGGLLARLPARRDKPELYVDATGVGRPVVDMMKAKGLRPIGISITAGNDVLRKTSDDVRIPKRVLASLMQVVLQARRLRIAEEMELTPILRGELEGFKVKININGNETFEAWRENVHDDLVLAAAIAVWGAENRSEPMRWMRFDLMSR